MKVLLNKTNNPQQHSYITKPKNTNAPKQESICCNYKGTENTHTHTKTPEYFMIRHPTSPLPLKQREEVTKNKVTAKI